MYKNPLVVGYKGKIGSFILTGLLNHMPKANNIWCTDVNNTKRETIDRIKKSDLIFLCVPIQETMNWITTYYKYLKGKTIVEQTSLKAPFFFYGNFNNNKIEKLNIINMHILFNPSTTPDFKDRLICFVKNKKLKEELCLLISNITNCYGITYFDTVVDHDKEMAKQQSLLHRVILALDNIIKDQGTTYIGKKIKELATRIKTLDPTLFDHIQNNMYFGEVLDKFKQELQYAPSLRPKI